MRQMREQKDRADFRSFVQPCRKQNSTLGEVLRTGYFSDLVLHPSEGAIWSSLGWAHRNRSTVLGRNPRGGNRLVRAHYSKQQDEHPGCTFHGFSPCESPPHSRNPHGQGLYRPHGRRLIVFLPKSITSCEIKNLTTGQEIPKTIFT